MSYSAEHMRKSRLTFVEWKNDDGSLADLFQSCKKFRTSVHEHGMSHQLDKVEREIEKLEDLMRLCAHIKDLKDLMRLLP